MDLVVARFRGGDGGRDSVDHHLDDLDLCLEASGSGEDVVDGFLKLWPRLEEVVGGGGRRHTNELYVVVGSEADLSNECLGKGIIDGIAEEQRCDVLRDGCTIPAYDEGSVAFGSSSRSGGGSGRRASGPSWIRPWHMSVSAGPVEVGLWQRGQGGGLGPKVVVGFGQLEDVQKRESPSSSATFVVCGTNFFTIGGSLSHLVGGGRGAWEALSSVLMWRRRALIMSWNPVCSGY